MKPKVSEIYLSIILVLGILISVNILSSRHFLRLDFTKDKEYTLSKATKNLIKDLDGTVTIIAYFSKELPSNLVNIRRQLVNTLADYKAYSHGKIVYKIIDPGKDQELENQAMRDGIAPVIVEIREKDQAKQQKAFMGLVIKYKNKKEVIPYIAPNSSIEYQISTAIKKLTVTSKPKIGIVQGFGCPPLSNMPAFTNDLSVLYQPEPLYYDSTRYTFDRYKVIALIAPQDSIPQAFFRDLDKYLANGGKLFLALNSVDGKLNANPPIGSATHTGVEAWLGKYGLKVYKSFVTDARCANIQIRQGNFPVPLSVPFPYFPIISTFENHPVTKGIDGVVMQFASPMEFKGDTAKIKFQPLAYTSKLTGLENPPVFFSTYKKWTNADFPYKHLIVGGILSSENWQIVVFGDGDFMQFPAGERYERSDNVVLAVNSIDYLADDLGLSQLRTKGITYKPLEQMSDSTKTMLKYGNFALPIILVILLGIIRSRRNANKRNKLKNS